MKKCCRCGEEKPLSEFNKDKHKPDGTRGICKICRKEDTKKYYYSHKDSIALKAKERNELKYSYPVNKEKRNAYMREYNKTYRRKEDKRELVFGQRQRERYKRKYGLTVEQVEQMHIDQDYKCAICGNEHDLLWVDHDHSNNEIRGLLCNNCNTGIGMFNDDTELLINAITYLLEFRKEG